MGLGLRITFPSFEFPASPCCFLSLVFLAVQSPKPNRNSWLQSEKSALVVGVHGHGEDSLCVYSVFLLGVGFLVASLQLVSLG
jgi:hypothetical protein